MGTYQDEDRLALLSYCLLCAFNASPLDAYLEGILHKQDSSSGGGYCGGDPGWEIDGNNDETGDVYRSSDGEPLLRCWAEKEISGIEPDTAYYKISEFRYQVRLALNQIAAEQTGKQAEVRQVVARYGL